jgi:hypothetical protein
MHRDEGHAVFARQRNRCIDVLDHSHRDAIGGVDGVSHLSVHHAGPEIDNRPDAKATELRRRHVADIVHRYVHVAADGLARFIDSSTPSMRRQLSPPH